MDKKAETAFPVHDLIAQRWSPRALDSRPVPPEQIRSLLEAARWAASSFNEQPWSFIVARREDADQFDRMLECLMEQNRMWARGASVLMLTVAKETFSRNDRPNRVAAHDVGQAAASLSLQATDLGLRVHQMGGIDLEKIRETYGIPDGYAPLTAIAIGYPGEVETLPEEFRSAESAPRERKTQTEFVFAGAWGEPANW
jgi:nitroreductase